MSGGTLKGLSLSFPGGWTLQFASSDPSGQSLVSSQRQVLGIQIPLLHSYCSDEQAAGGRLAAIVVVFINNNYECTNKNKWASLNQNLTALNVNR
jgi:hypothetical protein